MLLEQRKKEIEKELSGVEPLREELREIEALLRGASLQEPKYERGGPDDR